MASSEPRKDFFISYNKADKAWAEWIAWQLESEGFSVIIEAWDFQPGSNFVLEMHRATMQAQHTIAVLSPDYLSAVYTHPEWAAAFAQDPSGEKGTLIPVRVQECEIQGLLEAIVYIDLIGLEERIAKQALLSGVSHERGKPLKPPPFPGTDKPEFPKPPDPEEELYVNMLRDFQRNLAKDCDEPVKIYAQQKIIDDWLETRKRKLIK
jgi:hypothetical protein